MMTQTIGVIPAAGFGTRWGLFPKFLLPCGEKQWLLDRTINILPTEKSVVVYSDQTITEIVNHLARCNLLDRVILLKNTRMDLDFWGSMLAALSIEADYYYFSMPDTYPDPSVFYDMGAKGISLGTHYTLTPERYGMIRNQVVVNKSKGEPGWAWGVLGWTKEVRDLWLATSSLQNYTDAINLAIQECGVSMHAMAYYYDMSCWSDYVRFVAKMFFPRDQNENPKKPEL